MVDAVALGIEQLLLAHSHLALDAKLALVTRCLILLFLLHLACVTVLFLPQFDVLHGKVAADGDEHGRRYQLAGETLVIREFIVPVQVTFLIYSCFHVGHLLIKFLANL